MPWGRLELPSPKAIAPKAIVFANFTTTAYIQSINKKITLDKFWAYNSTAEYRIRIAEIWVQFPLGPLNLSGQTVEVSGLNSLRFTQNNLPSCSIADKTALLKKKVILALCC